MDKTISQTGWLGWGRISGYLQLAIPSLLRPLLLQDHKLLTQSICNTFTFPTLCHDTEPGDIQSVSVWANKLSELTTGVYKVLEMQC